MPLCKTVVLTPNQRLSRAARERHDKRQGEPLEAYPLQTWVTNLWENLSQKDRYLLNAHQVEKIFRGIIQADIPHLTPVTSLAIRAWQLLHEWEWSLAHPQFALKEESQHFQKWAIQYQSILKEKRWIDNEGVWEVIKTSLPQLSLPQEIILLGFSDFTPREKTFIQALKTMDVKIQSQTFKETPIHVFKTCLPDDDSEMEYVAQWAHEKSQQGTVACIFPELTAHRDKIYASFAREFSDPRHLNISLAKPLADYGLIKAAMSGLSLLEKEIDQKTLSTFLLSPYFEKSTGDISFRALLDKKIKASLPPIVEKSALPDYSFFKQALSGPTHRTLQEWTTVFQTHLHALGWTLQHSLNSEEYQLHQHWLQLNQALAKLDIILEKVSFSQALAELKQLAQNTLFQPETSSHARVEILGILEAAGLTFDYVWIAGMHEDAWPLKTTPNPFLPFSLAEQNQLFCKKVSEQLLCSGKEIMISFPSIRRDIPLYPSPIIKSIPDISLDAKTIAFESISLETLAKDDAPALNIAQMKHHGSEIFKDQAACPFRAFVKHRLGAKKMELPTWGVTPLLKGNLVHKMLEKIYETISSQEMLQALSQEKLKTLIQQCFQTFNLKENNIFIETEKNRIEKLILTWLSYEKNQRAPFAIAAREEKIEVYFNNIPLKLRIDRIDKIGENKYLIIDYKTGKNPAKIDPLDEPQLPLYCVISNLPIEEVAIAEIRSNEIKLKTTQADKNTWETILSQLASEYLLGNSVVKPLHGEETCRYCDLTSLCRIKSF